MNRRTLLLAIPQAFAQQPPDQWETLRNVWNPFAEKLNGGVLDLKLWRKVVAQVNRIEGRK
jgi:hypothetical protein